MTRPPSIPPFAVELEHLLPLGAMDLMSSAEVGVAYRTLRAAWYRLGGPCDLPTLIALARLTEADVVHVQRLITMASQPEPNGRSITFPILREAFIRARADLERRSRAGRAGANARWKGGEPPPDPGPGFRLMRSECDRIATASPRPPSDSDSSSSARRSSPGAQIQSAQIARVREAWAPSAGSNAPWAIDLSKLSPDQATQEVERRRLVHAEVHRARFPEAAMDKEFLPGKVSEAIILAPWVSPELAAYAVWEARRTVREFARRREAFNPIGLVIAITGTLLERPARVRQITLDFHREWERRQDVARKQHEVTQARNAAFVAEINAKRAAAGGGA